MNPIVFPGLGLELHLPRVAFTVFGWSVYWYGIIIVCGVALAVVYCSRTAGRYGFNGDLLLDAVLVTVPSGIVGARIYYVLFYQSIYRNADGSFNWAKAVAIWDGGLAIYGGIIAAVIALLILCRVMKLNFPAFADLSCCGLLIGQAVGRWGNFFNQEAYGSATDLPWRMGLTVQGEYIEVHPTFLYESLWNLAGLCIIHFVLRKHRRFDGQVFLFYLAWYGLGRVWIEGLRTDSLYLFGTGIRVSQLVAAICLFGAGALFVIFAFIRKPDPQNLYVNRIAAQSGAAVSTEESSAAKEHTPEPEHKNPEESDTEKHATENTNNEEEQKNGNDH